MSVFTSSGDEGQVLAYYSTKLPREHGGDKCEMQQGILQEQRQQQADNLTD